MFDTPSARVLELEKQIEILKNNKKQEMQSLLSKLEDLHIQPSEQAILNADDVDGRLKQHLENVHNIKKNYFFSMGLAMKLANRRYIKVNLNEAWDRVVEEDVPVYVFFIMFQFLQNVL